MYVCNLYYFYFVRFESISITDLLPHSLVPLIGWLVPWSVCHNFLGENLHFHAPIGALVLFFVIVFKIYKCLFDIDAAWTAPRRPPRPPPAPSSTPATRAPTHQPPWRGRSFHFLCKRVPAVYFDYPSGLSAKFNSWLWSKKKRIFDADFSAER